MSYPHNIHHPVTLYLRNAHPHQGLKHASFRCERALDFLNRAALPAPVRKELLSIWRYASSLTRMLARRWNAATTLEQRYELRYIHYTMLPALLTENVPWTSLQLNLYSSNQDLLKEWHDIWATIDLCNSAYADA